MRSYLYLSVITYYKAEELFQIPWKSRLALVIFVSYWDERVLCSTTAAANDICIDYCRRYGYVATNDECASRESSVCVFDGVCKRWTGG